MNSATTRSAIFDGSAICASIALAWLGFAGAYRYLGSVEMDNTLMTINLVHAQVQLSHL